MVSGSLTDGIIVRYWTEIKKCFSFTFSRRVSLVKLLTIHEHLSEFTLCLPFTNIWVSSLSAYHSRTSEWVHSAYHSRTSEWVHSQFLVGFLLLRFFLYSSLWTIIYLLFFYYLAILLSILYLRLLDYLFGIFKHFFRSKLFFLLGFISICLVVFAYFKCLYIVWCS